MPYTNTRDTLGDQTTLDGLVAHTLTELKEEGNTTLGSYALYSNTGLQTVEMPGLSSSAPGASAFAGCSALVSAAFPNLKSFGQYMFQSCIALTSVSAPEATSGAACAFSGCTSLTSVAFPKMTTLGQSMFYGCTKLASFSFSSGMTTIAAAAFYNCASLTSVSMSGIKTIGSSAFNGCSRLASVAFPAATTVSRSAFYNAPITTLTLTSVTSIQSNITNMAAVVDFSSKLSVVASAFAGDGNLIALILRNASQCTLANVNALTSTPIAGGYGYIYVPEDLVDTYKSASNWVTYASRIYSVGAYPRPIGTITDTWSEIMAAEANGTYTTKYSVGDTKAIDINGSTVVMQIVAMDADTLADDTGNAKITWMCLGLPYTQNMNATSTNADGWASSAMRTWLISDVFANIESDVKSCIKTVHKTYYDKTSNSTMTSDDDIWIPSLREMFGSSQSGAETSGCDYTSFFAAAADKIKKTGSFSLGSASSWWLRSATSHHTTHFWYVYTIGTASNTTANFTYGVAFGFCT